MKQQTKRQTNIIIQVVNITSKLKAVWLTTSGVSVTYCTYTGTCTFIISWHNWIQVIVSQTLTLSPLPTSYSSKYQLDLIAKSVSSVQ